MRDYLFVDILRGMKKHSKVGNQNGKPAYRTPSTFIARATKGKYLNPKGMNLSQKYSKRGQGKRGK